jgi:hypothetical protein
MRFDIIMAFVTRFPFHKDERLADHLAVAQDLAKDVEVAAQSALLAWAKAHASDDQQNACPRDKISEAIHSGFSLILSIVVVAKQCHNQTRQRHR